jgi:hypothetical protein
MRIMQIPQFPRAPKRISSLESLIKRRLIDQVVMWPDQAVPLVSYMAWPNNTAARSNWLDSHRRLIVHSGRGLPPRGFKIIQQHWGRVADILHFHFDLAHGRHQSRRGGASVGKAISLIDANAKSKGTGTAKLWAIWKAYKDVAHLVTAAILVSGEAQTRHRMAPYGLTLHQLQPYRIAMLLPDLVISVAMTFERYGLDYVAHGRTEPLFDPKSLWRIPSNINLKPLAPPVRKIASTDLAVLNARRAGNRGKAKRCKTTPVFD